MKKKFKIWHISDTHGQHSNLEAPEDVDVVIHSGDCSNDKIAAINFHEVTDFLNWFESLDIKYKIFVPGNHDTSIESGLITSYDFQSKGIMYLLNSFVTIDGIKIWGSPYTPTFGNWAFMKAKHKLHDIWQNIPEDTDILITHGPPKYILDLVNNFRFESCGDTALRKRVLQIKPRIHCFGHIHNNGDIFNAGLLKLSQYPTMFSNGSVVTDSYIKNGPTSNGNILYI